MLWKSQIISMFKIGFQWAGFGITCNCNGELIHLLQSYIIFKVLATANMSYEDTEI